MQKPWTKMTAAELARATRSFDGGPIPKAVKPSAAESAKHQQAMRKARAGRPRLGRGAARVLFTIDPSLLERLDAFARDHGMKRSNLIAIAAEEYMGRNSRGRKPGRTGGGSSSPQSPVPLAAAGS